MRSRKRNVRRSSELRGNMRSQGQSLLSLFELVGAELYLNEILGEKVDLVPKRDVREELRETIFREAIAI